MAEFKSRSLLLLPQTVQTYILYQDAHQYQLPDQIIVWWHQLCRRLFGSIYGFHKEGLLKPLSASQFLHYTLWLPCDWNFNVLIAPCNMGIVAKNTGSKAIEGNYKNKYFLKLSKLHSHFSKQWNEVRSNYKQIYVSFWTLLFI